MTYSVPATVAASIENRRRANAERLTHGCGQGANGHTCDARPAVLMPRGYRCEQHRPAIPTPDPTRTLAALRDRNRETEVA